MHSLQVAPISARTLLAPTIAAISPGLASPPRSDANGERAMTLSHLASP